MSTAPSPVRVYAAGICALVLCLGVARFAYTPMIAHMQDQTGLSEGLAGWLAGWNYLGYLSGVLVVTRLKDMVLKDRLYRFGLVLAVLTTAMMGLGTDPVLWGASRYLAGLAAAAGLMLSSGLILNWLIRHDHAPELGIHFTGVGAGIVFGAVVVEVAARFISWDGQWWLLTLAGALLALPAWFWMPRPSSGKPLTEAHRDSGREPCKSWLWLLQGAYALAGFGYVVQATFLVLITEEAPGMEGKGGLMWLLAGLAAAPATLLWDRIARRVGYLSALQWCFAAQIVSLMIPVFWGGLSAAIAASVLAGGTFIGIVSLVLTMVGRLFPAHPASIMAKLTLGYSVAQIVGPVLAGEMAEASGTFAGGLLMAVGLMALGWIGLLLMRRVERRAVV